MNARLDERRGSPTPARELRVPPPQLNAPLFGRVSIRTRLYGNAALLALSLGAVAVLASYGGSLATDGLDRMLVGNRIQRDQMEIDMMHDALRADVLAAIVADADGQAEVRASLEEHIERLQGLVADLDRDIQVPAVRQAFSDVEPVLRTYVSTARAQVELSGRDEEAAIASLPAFQTQFETLEDSLEAFGDAVEAEVTLEQTAGKAAVQELLFALMALASAAALLGGGTSVMLGRGIVRRIDTVVEGIYRFAGGDLTSPVQIQGDDEIAAMARAVNECIVNTGGAIRAVSDGANALAMNAANLSGLAQVSNLEMDNMGTQLQGASSGAGQVSANVQAVAGGMDEMSAAMHEIARNAVQAARVASTAVQSAEETSAAVARLGDSGAEIGKFVKVISTIANQTNLLALNATIEAARAGEAGRGFAVVANEVKELARETARATDDIARKIEAIQADTRTAVETNEQIASVIGQINDLQTAIAGAVEEQTATGNEIARNLQEAARASAVVATAIGDVARSAQAASAGAAESEQATGRLAALAVDLESTCSRFRT